MKTINMLVAGHSKSFDINTNAEVCYATHPMQPNFDGHARGRKLHFVKESDKTFCNMLVDSIKKPDQNGKYFASVGICKSCLNKLP